MAEFSAEQHQLGALRSILRQTLATADGTSPGQRGRVEESAGESNQFPALNDASNVADTQSSVNTSTGASAERMEFLSNALDAMAQDSYEVLRTCSNILAIYQEEEKTGNDPVPLSAVVRALSTLMEECYDIDQAKALIGLGTVPHLIKLLSCTDVTLKEKSARLLSIISQNNPPCSLHVFQCGALAPLCNTMKSGEDGGVVAACISAVSMVVHEQEASLDVALRMGVLDCLASAMASFPNNNRVKQKSAFFVVKSCNWAGEKFRTAAVAANGLIEILSRMAADEEEYCRDTALQAVTALSVSEEARSRIISFCPILRNHIAAGVSAAAESSRDNERARAAAAQYRAEATVFGSQDTVFVPSNEWQEVPEGQHVPAGLEIRMDFQTGKRFARTLSSNMGPNSTALTSIPQSTEETNS